MILHAMWGPDASVEVKSKESLVVPMLFLSTHTHTHTHIYKPGLIREPGEWDYKTTRGLGVQGTCWTSIVVSSSPLLSSLV